MRILTMTSFALVAMFSTGVLAQGQRGASPQKEVQKSACQRDARLIYRTGKAVTGEARQQVKAVRKAYVQECMMRAGFAG
jgi:hypothetical protein